MSSKKSNRQRERGSSAITFPFILIVFLFLLLAVFNFSFLFTIQSAMNIAAQNGARAALRYQASLSSRINTANSVASNTLTWLQGTGPVSITTTGNSCSYNANLICFTTQIQLPYGQHPIVPPLVNFPIFGSLAVPQTLTASATMQMPQGNLNPGNEANNNGG